MQSLLYDIRYALRQLRKSPGFALTAVITLALGVGLATAVFCIFDAVILRPLPYVHPEKIVSIESRSQSGYVQPPSWDSYQDERARSHAFAALAGYMDWSQIAVDTQTSGPLLLDSVRATDNFFQVFGVQPYLGRTFLPGEDQEGKNDIVVLGFDTWQTYFGGDRGVLGRQVKLDSRSYTIIGVMPAGFRFPLAKREAVYIPLHRDKSWMTGRGNHWVRTVARLRDGVTLQQAQADLSLVFSDLARSYPQTDSGRTVHLQEIAQSATSRTRGPLWTLLGAVLAVLAIGCVNVAGLLLARGVKREREMALRSAIGAGRRRLVAQMLTEGLLLGVFGVAGGVALAWTLLDLMRKFLMHAFSRGADIYLDWNVLAGAIGLALVVSLAASLYPALRLSAIDPNRALKSGGSAGTQRGQHHLRSGFVVTQVALTLVLLVVAGMLIRMVTQYRHADFGFDPSRILATDLNLSPARYQNVDIVAEFYRPFLSRASQIPGVRAAGVVSLLPIRSWGSNSDIHIAGQPPYPPHQEMLTENRFVSRGYFDVFGIPLRRGRTLSPSLDRRGANPTVVVNEAFVKKFIPSNLDPTAQRIDDGQKEENWTRIVGVVGNIRQDIYSPTFAERDWLIDELPAKDVATMLSGMSLVIRFDGDPASIVSALRNVLHEADPTVPFQPVRTMSEVVADALVFERMEGWLFGIFASLALALSLIGLYGLVSHEVEQSTRDIGVRMALGATRPRIVSMVMRRVTWMVGGGAALGLVLTFAAQRVIDMVIYVDAQKEAGGFVLLALLLTAAGMMAALIPASRAASIEPMEALRTE